MRQRSLGPGAHAVSSIGLGGMPLSIADRPSTDIGVRVIQASLDAGITLIDTADVYCLDESDIGHNERLIARALAEWGGNRDTVVVATKGGLIRPDGRWERKGTPDHLRRACEQSLAALRVSRLDLYQLHAPDPDVPFVESIGALADLRSEGKIRWVGLSNVSVQQIKHAESVVPVVSVQNRLSPFFREALETGVVDYCTERGIGFLAYSPVGGGRLNKKLATHAALLRIGANVGLTPHQLVLAWVLAQGPSVIPIPGARSVEHALSSAKVADVDLPEDTLRDVGAQEFSRA